MRPTLTALALALLLVGCDSPTEAPPSPDGSYAAAAFDGVALPVMVEVVGAYESTLVSGVLSLDSGAFEMVLTHEWVYPGEGDDWTLEHVERWTGVYSGTAENLTLTAVGVAGSWSGSLTTNALTLTTERERWEPGCACFQGRSEIIEWAPAAH